MVDTLAKRYGWPLSEISENMYWEEVYEMYELSCNLNVIEKNDDMKFQFILHSGTKDAAKKWKDLPIPFPNRKWNPKPSQTRMPKAFERHAKKEKMSPAQRERLEYVKKRMEEHKKKMATIHMDRYSGYYN